MRELAAVLTRPGVRTNAERADLGAQIAKQVEALDELLRRSVPLPHAPQQPSRRHTVTISREQLEDWAGRALSDDETDLLDVGIPNSTIPEAIGIMTTTFAWHDETP